MNNKYFSLFIVIALISVAFIPVFVSAASSNYDFNIMYRVDGKATNTFHNLNKGTAEIDGYAFYNGYGAPGTGQLPPGEKVTYCLYRDKFGFDANYGCVEHRVETRHNMNNPSFIKKLFPDTLDVDSSKYYLTVSSSNNGWRILGAGKLTNP